MINNKAAIREEVHQLAEEAFQRKLISGYGDGANGNEYQIVCEGKPRHFNLEYARSFLRTMIHSTGM